MFSPERTIEQKHDSIINKTPKRSTTSTTASSPLRLLSPIIDAIRSNQTKATRDFDRFYGNLTSWVNLTPRSNNSRIRKQTPEITNKMRQHQQRNRTSLTPLLERHSIHERKRSNERIAPSPPRFELEIGDSQMQEMTPNSNLDSDYYYKTPTRASTRQSSRLVQTWLDDESKRIEKLQTTLSGIKRQSSLLASNSISKNIPSMITTTTTTTTTRTPLKDDDDDDDDDNIFSIMSSPSDRYQNRYIINKNTYTRNRNHNYNHNNNNNNNSKSHYISNDDEEEEEEDGININSNIINNNNNNNRIISAASPLKESLQRPSSKRYRLADISPIKEPIYNDNHTPTTPLPLSTPTKKTKLTRPSELSRSSSSSSICDRFWNQIHDINQRKANSATSSPIHRVRQDDWASDDQFWSDQSSNAAFASKLNNRLYKIAREEERNRSNSNKMDFDLL